MKTKSELDALRAEVSAMNERLPVMEQREAKQAAARLDSRLVELDEDDLAAVTAGTALSAGSRPYTYYYHTNCGGMIHNVGNPFRYCYCDRCGEEHYWHYSFDYYEVYDE